MLKRTVLKSLLMISAGVLAFPACRIDRSSTGGAAGGESGSGGGGGSGGTVGPTMCSYSAPYEYAVGQVTDEAAVQKAKEAIANMSLKDKVIQISGVSFGSATEPQFGDIQRQRDTETIRGFRWRDASRGLDLAQDYEGSNLLPAWSTAFPVSVARGAAFDLDLEYEIGMSIAEEFITAKQTLLLAPCMNLIRHPLHGRAQESYSEDPFHTGRLASALAIGIQQWMPADAKHYLGYSVERDRPNNDTIMEDEQTLREIYGRHFRMVIQDGGVVSVMAAYNKVNGEKATQSKHLLTKVLREDFGFKGFVISDWFAMPGYADPNIDAPTMMAVAQEALEAGLDVESPWVMHFTQLESMVANKVIDEALIDRAVERVLTQKFRFNVHSMKGPWGLKTPTTTFSEKPGEYKIENNDEHIKLAQKAAEMSMVLLKNENKTLPIPSSVKKVAVIGATVPYQTSYGPGTAGYAPEVNFATDVRTGDLGSSRVFFDPAKGSSPFAGIKAWADKKGGISVYSGKTAEDVQADTDFVVVVAGLTAEDEGEEYNGSGDRTSLELDNKNLYRDGPLKGKHVQDDLIKAVAALKKPMVVVLEGGAAIAMPWLSQVPAVVMAWYPGMVGGRAMANLLFGEVQLPYDSEKVQVGTKISFSGKLPVSWPNDLSELDPFNEGRTTFYYDTGYRLYDRKDKKPLFGFGHGLSYTKFEYGDVSVGCEAVASGDMFPVTVKVKNAGDIKSDEIVMVFVSFPDTKARRGVKELKAFKRVTLDAGEEKEVTIPVRVKDLDYFDNDKDKWIIEEGEVEIKVGPSWDNLPKTAKVMVKP